jgi:ATPases of the AAA+ class
MNQDLLIRLFRSIEGEPTEDIVKVAKSIITEEEKKGHLKLASKLKEILANNIQSYSSFRGELKSILPKGITIPKDKRFHVPLATFVDREHLRHEMILPEFIEQKINRIEQEYVARERLKNFGLKPKQKILLYGAPGCGKSMSAERIAYNIGLPFLKVRFEAIISSYLGESANNLKSLFDAIENIPCVLLLDEFDFIAKSRSYGQDVGEMHRIVNLLLGFLEDFKSSGILIATTNFEGAIDFAMFRRFDEIIEMPLPSTKEIKRILLQTLSSISVSKDVDWEGIVKRLEGFSAALVVKVGNDSAKIAVLSGERTISNFHLEKALTENKVFKKS